MTEYYCYKCKKEINCKDWKKKDYGRCPYCKSKHIGATFVTKK